MQAASTCEREQQRHTTSTVVLVDRRPVDWTIIDRRLVDLGGSSTVVLSMGVSSTGRLVDRTIIDRDDRRQDDGRPSTRRQSTRRQSTDGKTTVDDRDGVREC